VTLEVRPGEIFGLLGPNGAGKTTFIKLLCTLLLPSTGEAYVHGYHVVHAAYKVKQLLGLVTSEERSFFWRLTGRQNLRFFAALYQLSPQQTDKRITELLELLDLQEVADFRFNEYSTGMKQKLAIARGLLHQPRILFMDEPTKGLDPISAQTLLALIRQRVAGFLGSTIILTTHILRDVEQLCDRMAIMHKGKIIACGSVAELRWLSTPYEQYRLKVRGLSEQQLQQLNHLYGVTGCTKVSQQDGIVELILQMRKETNALSKVLHCVVQARCDILYCTIEEEKLEHVFSHFVQSQSFPQPEEPHLC
jgi:ABC-2 type transport system ATP-binding protein